MTDAPLAIRGIGVHGGFGCGADALSRAVRGPGTPNDTMEVASADGPVRLPVYTADLAPLAQYVPKKALRRVNRFSKLALLGACAALEDAGLSTPEDREGIGIVIASGYGASKSTFDFLDSMIEEDGTCPSPTVFANSVHCSAASNLSILLGIRGPCLTVSQFELSPVSGLLSAREWLRTGRVKAVLFGAVDELCAVLGYSYDRFFHGSSDGPMRPLDLECQTAVPGEGAAFMVLASEGGDAGHGWLDGIAWENCGPTLVPGGMHCVLGAEGHACHAPHYRAVLGGVDSGVSAYSPAFGSFPSGQVFDILAATLDAEHEGFETACCVKSDSEGNCGVVKWRAPGASTV
ncbi:MAG: beta-ketoacyl synthase chain length factor [Lentisphaeria bacterium]|nr:beta-ketoacyl synthase chain length factor [Lentisphaeria bacterium]